MTWIVGKKLQPLQKPAFTREQLQEYASASGDHNPIHLNPEFAKKAGFDSVIVHGMLSMAYLGDHIVFNFPSPEFSLMRFKARFRKVTFPGDSLRCEGEVKKCLPNGNLLLAVRAQNQSGEVITEAEAEVAPLVKP